MKDRIVLAGGSGFLGRMLNRWFAARGWEVVVLSRRRSPGQDMHRTVFWDGESLGDWRAELEGAIAVVNLSGRSVDCRYHRRNREQIMNSRVRSTRVLGKQSGNAKILRAHGSIPAPQRSTVIRLTARWTSGTARSHQHRKPRMLSRCRLPGSGSRCFRSATFRGRGSGLAHGHGLG